eukprot:6199855-Pleurochrysis_carterae.AAC.1
MFHMHYCLNVFSRLHRGNSRENPALLHAWNYRCWEERDTEGTSWCHLGRCSGQTESALQIRQLPSEPSSLILRQYKAVTCFLEAGPQSQQCFAWRARCRSIAAALQASGFVCPVQH